MNQEYEAEIDLKDLFFYVLYKWRSILISALVCGALVCGGRLLFNIAEARAEGSGGKPKAVREYELKLAEYELIKASYNRNIEEYQILLSQQEIYCQESILMQINTYNVPCASADFFLKLDGIEWEDLPNNSTLDPTDSLVNIYTSNFLATIDWEPIEKITGKSALYLKELIGLNADYNSNTFTVWVRHSDGGIAQQILEIIINQIMDKYQGMNSDVSRHTLSVINHTLTYSIDSSLADSQKWNIDAIANYEQAIINCRADLEALQKPQSPMGIKKIIALGCIAGAFIMIAFYGTKYLFDGRLHRKYELQSRYGFQLLGVLPNPKKTGPLQIIDRILNAMDGTDRQPPKKESYELIAADIINRKNKAKNILAAGTLDMKKLQEVSDALSPLLPGITLRFADNMGRTADSFHKLAECDSIILIEKRHTSYLEEIRREQECISASNKSVIGYILL